MSNGTLIPDSNRTLPPEEIRFEANAKELSLAIKDGVGLLHKEGYNSEAPMLIEIGIQMMRLYPRIELIEGFIRNSHEFWIQIHDREERFFIENAYKVWKHIPVRNIDVFRSLFGQKRRDGSYVVPLELREQIWKIFHAMVKISIKYVHRERKPIKKQDSSGYSYTVSFMDEIDIAHHSRMWGIEL